MEISNTLLPNESTDMTPDALIRCFSLIYNVSHSFLAPEERNINIQLAKTSISNIWVISIISNIEEEGLSEV
jgi:hypothetical protein